ncbi:MAG: segregation/condensation protein A [Candidatus Pacearchaeota archaeon]|jgi:segregation and condensation protein A
MGFEEYLPNQDESVEKDYSEDSLSKNSINNEKISQNQLYEVITSRKPDWQAIIYELIDSEQLDPWDIDIVILTRKYFEKLAELEQADFYVSSKVLLAASLLLRIKSEFLLNKYIKSIDDILFGRKDKPINIFEKIEIDENDLPVLIPKTPLPRQKRITLQELITALNKAIVTESRRIKREVAIKTARKLSEVDFPTFSKIDLKDRIKQFYAKILTTVKKRSKSKEKEDNVLGYSAIAGADKDERLACFLPLLHLSNNKKLWLEQYKHLDEIWIYLYEYFDKNRDYFKEELVQDDGIEEIIEGEENLDDPLSVVDAVTNSIKEAEQLAEIALRELQEEGININLNEEDIKNEIRNEIIEEIEKEEKQEAIQDLEEEIKEDIKDIEKEKKIDNVSGFSDEML